MLSFAYRRHGGLALRGIRPESDEVLKLAGIVPDKRTRHFEPARPAARITPALKALATATPKEFAAAAFSSMSPLRATTLLATIGLA
jgi:hypothetical protein